jgi:formamidopyrimidine-DNA glycosylase
MPELPDVEAYLHALRPRVVGATIERLRLGNPFIIRTYDPPASAVERVVIREVGRIGKRLVFAFDGELFMVVHLMIAGRLRWREPGAALPRKIGLAAFDLERGTLLLTEAGSKRQASIHIVRGMTALREFDRGGLEVFAIDLDTFSRRLTAENHTLKRALTDPHIFSGIGNAYSDEILHAARLSPMKLTSSLAGDETERLFQATQETLQMWVERLRGEAGDEFPEKVTAFRKDMAVHGKYGTPVCGNPIQRIVYASNEANYCARCQTGGKLLSDRALSRLLGQDWPKTLEEMEVRRRQSRE